jgi:hypothetical protein
VARGSVLFRCSDCGRDVDPTDIRTLHEIRGFAKHRAGGGQNHVLFREETGRYLCELCATRKKYVPEQGTLL